MHKRATTMLLLFKRSLTYFIHLQCCSFVFAFRPLSFLSIIMILLQHYSYYSYYYYLMTLIWVTKFQASIIISSEPREEDALLHFKSVDSGLAAPPAPLQERDPINDITNSESPAGVFLANAATYQSDSDDTPSAANDNNNNNNNDISTFDQTLLLEGDNILPSPPSPSSNEESTLASASVSGVSGGGGGGAEINNKQVAGSPDNNKQDSALLPWDDGNGSGEVVVPDLIPNLPSLSLPSLPESFPDAVKVFENIMKGGVWPEEPDCDDVLFSFCCESGPPKSKIKKGTSAERIREIEAERKQRLRKCVKCL